MTEVKCKICNVKIKFDQNNPDTYLYKTESGNAMIGKLLTIRVSHKAGSESFHINVIVIDEKGEYRAHKDYYEEMQDKEGTSDLWNKFQRHIPLELRIYLTLADNEDKKILTSSSESFDKKLNEWYEYLIKLKDENPNNQLITFLAVKWGLILGKGKELINYTYKPKSWSYPIFLRLQARFSPTPELIMTAKNMDYTTTPLLIQIEAAVAKSEVFLRLSAYELLEELYNDCQNKWSKQTSIDVKTGLMLLQGYYGFRLYFLGKINEALELIEPVFNFGQITENREIISITGNFYAAVNQSSGDLELALKIFDIVLKVSEEIGDERTHAVISSNMSVLESKQGLYDQALKRQRALLELPIVQEEFFIRSSLMSAIAETLFISERYEESKELCQKVLSEENLPSYYKLDLLSTLKRIAGKTESNELLDFVRNNLPDDSDILNSPVGSIFMHDLNAIDGELHGNWVKMIDNLKEERKIMFKNQSVEDASDIEIRLAEGYFSYYQESEKLEYLNHAYNHLDLAKTIAIEKQNYFDLCRLVMLKGLLAEESKLPKQARTHFKEALKIANEHNLVNLEKELSEQLDQLNAGTSKRSAGSILRRMFTRLTFRKTEEGQTRQKSIVYSIYIEAQDSQWNLILQNELNASLNDTNYLLGFHDLWTNIEEKWQQQQVNYFTVSRGAVVIENSPHFQLFAFCDHLDYLTRLTLQNFLPALEDFSPRDNTEELEAKIMNTLRNDIGKFMKAEKI
ncbi:hypothetical protein LCGC14_0934220 [marine sediment metagenome]|uniref:MalT-like TPR region domain-containing protein n=1 Tax=marine sediment metagenome TaxID=412755 RepID=A0A0F9RTJ2_9ZZZZ